MLFNPDKEKYNLFQKATSVCSSLGLSKTMLKSCIYDVAVTNDTSMAKQDILKQGLYSNYTAGR